MYDIHVSHRETQETRLRCLDSSSDLLFSVERLSLEGYPRIRSVWSSVSDRWTCSLSLHLLRDKPGCLSVWRRDDEQTSVNASISQIRQAGDGLCLILLTSRCLYQLSSSLLHSSIQHWNMLILLLSSHARTSASISRMELISQHSFMLSAILILHQWEDIHTHNKKVDSLWSGITHLIYDGDERSVSFIIHSE